MFPMEAGDGTPIPSRRAGETIRERRRAVEEQVGRVLAREVRRERLVGGGFGEQARLDLVSQRKRKGKKMGVRGAQGPTSEDDIN